MFPINNSVARGHVLISRGWFLEGWYRRKDKRCELIRKMAHKIVHGLAVPKNQTWKVSVNAQTRARPLPENTTIGLGILALVKISIQLLNHRYYHGFLLGGTIKTV